MRVPSDNLETNYFRMKYLFFTLIILCLNQLSLAQQMDANILLQKLKNGICVGEFDKIEGNQNLQNNEKYFELVRNAGFKSIRFFQPSYKLTNVYKPVIDDALAIDLVVNLCLTANGANSKIQFVNKWHDIAMFYKDYDNRLVFEILNEPKLYSSTNTLTDAEVMEWINDAIAEIRAISPNRILLVGGAGFLQPEYLKNGVNPTHLTYQVNEINFTNDKNLIGAFHHYEPYKYTMPKGVRNTLADFSTWQKVVTDGLNTAENWRKTWNKPVVLTEWGAQNNLKDTADFLMYNQFFTDELRKRNIGWFYYSAVPHDLTPPVLDANTYFFWTILYWKSQRWYNGLLPVLTGIGTSVKMNSNPEVQIGYHPANKMLSVENTDDSLSLTITDLTGRNVHCQSLNGSNTFHINLKSGIYIITLKNNKNHLITKKIAVQ